MTLDAFDVQVMALRAFQGAASMVVRLIFIQPGLTQRVTSPGAVAVVANRRRVAIFLVCSVASVTNFAEFG